MPYRWIFLILAGLSMACVPPTVSTDCATAWVEPKDRENFPLPPEASGFGRVRSGGRIPTQQSVSLFIRPIGKGLMQPKGSNCALVLGFLADWNPALSPWISRTGIKFVAREEEADWVLESGLLHLRVTQELMFLVSYREYHSQMGFTLKDRRTGKLLWWTCSNNLSKHAWESTPKSKSLEKHLDQHLKDLGEAFRAGLNKG